MLIELSGYEATSTTSGQDRRQVQRSKPLAADEYVSTALFLGPLSADCIDFGGILYLTLAPKSNSELDKTNGWKSARFYLWPSVPNGSRMGSRKDVIPDIALMC